MIAAERSVYRFPNAGQSYYGDGRTYENGWLSPSSINSYLACPLCWKWERIDRFPKAMAIDLPIGGAVHKAVEHLRRRRLSGEPFDLIAPDALEEAGRHFDQQFVNPVDDETGGEVLIDLKDFEDEGKAKDAMIRWSREFLPWIDALDTERGLIFAEAELSEFDVPQPFPFTIVGRIDAGYGAPLEEPRDYEFRLGADTKTSKKQAAPGLSAVIQTGIYREFVGGDWLVDVLAKTQTPTFRTYSIAPTEAQAAEVRRLVMDVAEHICAGDFPPRPGYLCHYDHGLPAFSVTVGDFPS